MPQTIAKLYASPETAAVAAKELRDHGPFAAADIHVIARPQANDTTVPSGSVLDQIIATGVDPAHAGIYADRVAQGQALVTVLPHFGLGMTATRILDSHDPATVDLPEPPPPPAAVWDPAAPLSSALGLRVLLSDPAPLSNYIKQPTLKPKPESSKTLDRIRAQSRDAAPLSTRLGYKTLSDDPTPLSTKVGWRVLLQKAAPLSEKLGWQLLSNDPAPLSTKLGWRLLLNDPAPLSRMLGWPLLSNNPTPLSTKLGWKVLSKD